MLQDHLACKLDSHLHPSGQSVFFLPSTSPALGSFSRPIILENRGYLLVRALHCFFSFGAHFACVTAIVFLAPLFFSPQPYFLTQNTEFVTVPLALSQLPASPIQKAKTGATMQGLFASVPLAPPTANSRRFQELSRALPPPEIPSKGRDTANVLDGVVGGFAADIPYPAAVRPDLTDEARFRLVGGDITNSRVINGFALPYPVLAQIAHVVGKVVIHAVIDESGKVIKAKAVSGPLLLAKAAVEAVSRERFQPTILDGRPIECVLTVNVSFSLKDTP